MRQPHRPSRRTVILFWIVAAFLALAWFVLGKTTFLARTAMYYAKPAIEKQLNSKFVSAPFEGNPVTGFIVKNPVLSQGGAALLTADEFRITVDVASSLANFSPKINLEAFGLRTSVDNAKKMLPKTNTAGPIDIIVSSLKLKDASVTTKFGMLKIKSGDIDIENSESFSANLHGNIEDLVGFSLKGAVKKTKGNWTADNLKLRLDDGTAEVNGSLYPATNAEVKTNRLNLSKLTSVFPSLRAYGVRGILTSHFTVKHADKQLETVGSMSLHNALIRGIPIEGLSVRWNYGKGKLRATFNDAGVRNSALTGFVNFNEKGNDSYIDMDVSTSKLTLATLTDQFKEQLGEEKLLPEGTIEGARVRLSGKLTNLAGKIELLPSDISYGDLVFKKLGGSVAFDGTQKGSISFSALHNGKPVTLKGTLAFAPNVPTNMKLSATGFPLEEFYKAVPALKDKNAKGTLALDATVTGMAKHWKLDANLSSQQLTADKFGSVQNLKLNAIYLFENGNLNIKNLSALWNGGKINASGIFDNTKVKPSIDFSGNFSGIQSDRLYELLKFMDKIHLNITIDGRFKLHGTLSDPIVEANLSSSGGTVMKGAQILSASTKLSYRNYKVIAEDLNFNTPYGPLQSRCEANIKGVKTWSWDAKFDTLRMRILNGIFGLDRDFRGIASGNIKFYSIGKGMQWTASLDNTRFWWRTFRFDAFTGKLDGTKDTLRFDHVNFEFCKGKGVVNGTATIGKSLDTSNLNVDINASKINLYEVIRRHVPAIRNIQGTAQLAGKVTGTLKDPVFTGNAQLAPVRIGVMYIPQATTDITASLRRMRFGNISVTFPEGTAEGKAFLGNKNGKWHTAFKLTGQAIDLNKLLKFAGDSVRSAVSGKVNLDLHAKCPLDELNIKGTITSDRLLIKGISFEKLNAPFYYTDNYLMIEDLNVDSNSGHISGGFAYNVQSNFWGARLIAEDFNIGTAFEHIYGKDKPGKITGKANLKLRVGGDSLQLSSLSAAGTLTATDGAISGFKFLDSAKKYTKGNPVRFSRLQGTFRFDNGSLILLPGTQAVAPAGDPVYRMATIDGYITQKGEISLMCLGKFNIRALNSILGGVSGLVDMTRTMTSKGYHSIDTKELLQSVLGGVLGGATRSSFRFVSIGLGGTLKSPKLTKLIVESDARRKNKGTTIPVSASDPDERKMRQDGDITFNLHFEIPVGYGKNSEPGDIAGQFMQDTLKSLISNITF